MTLPSLPFWSGTLIWEPKGVCPLLLGLHFLWLSSADLCLPNPPSSNRRQPLFRVSTEESKGTQVFCLSMWLRGLVSLNTRLEALP